MSSEYSTIHSSRGDKDRSGVQFGTSLNVVKPGTIPRTFISGGGVNSVSIKGGDYVYPKAGETVFFYNEPNNQSVVGKSKNQVNQPVRSGFDLVGTATGQVVNGEAGAYIQVSWVNSYVNHNLFKADEKVNESKVSWVDASKVSWQSNYQTADEKENGEVDLTPQLPAGSGSGVDTTTLGYAAVAAALVFGTKKKKRK